MTTNVLPFEAGAQHDERESTELTVGALLLIVVTAVAALVASYFSGPSLSGVDWLGLALLVVCAVAAERFQLQLYGESSVSVSFIFLLAAAIQEGASGVVIVAPLMALAGHDFALPPSRLIFNASVTILGGLAAAAAVGLTTSLSGADMAIIVAALVAALVNYGLTAGLVAGVIALNHDLDVAAVWREKFQWLLPHYLVLGLFGFLLAYGYEHLGVAGFLVMLAPPLLVNYGMKQYVDRTAHDVRNLQLANDELREANLHISEMSEELAEAYQETLHALVSALESRDHEIYGHSERVTTYSLMIAREMGIDESGPFWRDLEHGAFLHDVGKIGVPDRILHKRSSLTDDEWQIMRGHTLKGYAMLNQVRFLHGAAEVARSHHEHFDGSGYPRGLAGDEIPLTARVFAIADAFDAMCSKRSYKPARSVEESCAEIARCRGAQFDPAAVDAFLAIDWHAVLGETQAEQRAA